MKKKIIIILSIIILGIIVWSIYSYRVRFIGGKPIGDIRKDEKECVTATIYVTLYNGTYTNKKVAFDVDGGKEYLEGELQKEKYEVTEIEILEGNGRVDMENMILTIPGGEKVRLMVVAQNTYVGTDYQGEAIYLQKAPPSVLLLLNGCRENGDTTALVDDSSATEESSTQASGQTEKPVIYEFLSAQEIDQAQGLLAGNYQTLVQDVEECGTVDEYEVDGGRILIVGDGYNSWYNWEWRVLIDDIDQMYIQHRQSDEVKFYTNASAKEMPDMVWYLVDEEVRNHAVFNSFIENEISAYDPAVDRDMYMADYYEEYHYGKNNVFDESWGIYGVHFMAEDLDGDEKEELLVLLQWNAYVGDLFVFHETDGELYAWQEWNGFYDDRCSDIICYDDGMIRTMGALGVVYGHYNSDGMLEGMWWREKCEHVDSENEDEMYKYGFVELYKDGMEWDNMVKHLYYEGICRSDKIYDTEEDTSEWTSENQLIKKECDAIVEEWHHSGEGRRISAIQYEDGKGIIMLDDLLRMGTVPAGVEGASVYDGEYTLTLGMEFEEFQDYYGEEYIPSRSTPTQLIGTQKIDGKYYDWYAYDYEDISIITTDYNRKTGDSSIYTICGIDLWDTPRFHTSKGITIGDTLEELETAYGKELKLTDGEGHDCGYVYTENGIVTQFYMDEDSIVNISIQLR